MEKDKRKRINDNKLNKVIIGTMIFFCTLLIIYFGATIYFMNHFYFKSKINGVNVSGKTVKQVDKRMASQIKSYKLSLKELNGKKEQIGSENVGLKYNSSKEFQKLKDKQKAYKWVSAIFNSKDRKMTAKVSYDKKLLKEKVDNLSCFDSKNVVEPKNPSFKYSDKSYTIVDEVNGNKVNKTILYDNIEKSILNNKTTLDLKATNCYIMPKYTTKSKQTAENRDLLNKYVSSQITYTFGDNKEIIDGSKINNWLTVDEDFKVKFDEKKINEYMDALSYTYNTVGKTRSFVTSSGRTINVGGGDYGWEINTSKEIQSLIADIKEGKTIKKEPAYNHTAVSHGSNDIGNTYVEIDITKQHLWFYKNGSLVVQGDVVTGNVSINHSTPTGIYILKYKQRNATLKGEDYSTPVDFWMPFSGGVGIHDANWRSEFGGQIYMTNGSHGCVNAPPDLAKTIFENISAGTPVVCFNW